VPDSMTCRFVPTTAASWGPSLRSPERSSGSEGRGSATGSGDGPPFEDQLLKPANGGGPKTSLPKLRSSRKPKPYVIRKPFLMTASGAAQKLVPM
jgi:hypothetical protein